MNGKEVKFKPCNFSLTQTVSDDIDKLTLKSRTIRVNRSDVVKAGVEALKKMSVKEFDELLKSID